MAQLMLLFRVGVERYALETSSIVEIIHRVELSQPSGLSANTVGRFNYHGQIIPVFDLSQILGEIPSQPTLGTRIVLVKDEQGEMPYPLTGLLVEHVTETIEFNQLQPTETVEESSSASYLGATLLYQQEMIQCLHINKLLAEL